MRGVVSHYRIYAIIAGLMILSIVSTFSPWLIVEGQGYLPPGIPREELFIMENFQGRATVPDQFNVWVVGIASAPYAGGVHQLMLTALWYINYTDGSIINGLAAELPIISEDCTELTVKLKPGIYWSDGVEHTSEDWIYTINKALEDPKHSFNAYAVPWIKEVKAVDNYTFKIELKKPFCNFWTYFAVAVWSAWLYPMPAHIFKEVEAKGTPWYEYKFYPPVSLGPYVLIDHDPSGYWYLWKLRDDWERTAVGMWLKEKLGRTTWTGPKYVLAIAFDTEEQRIAAIARNEVDYLFDVTFEAFQAIRSLNPYARSILPQYPYMEPNEIGFRSMYYNLEKYPYNLTEVRWALTLAINMTDFIISTHKGISKTSPINAPYNFGMFPLFEKVLPWLETFELTLPNGTKFKPYDPDVPLRIAQWAVESGYLKSMPSPEEARLWWGPGWWKYAPDVAEQLLKSVGFYRGPDGKWRLPDGTPWKITIYGAGPWEIDATRMVYGIAEQWRKFGIDVEVKTLDSSTFWTINFVGQFEVGGWWGFGSEGVSVHDWIRLLVTMHSRYAQPSGNWSTNFMRIRDPVMDQLLDKLVAIPSVLPNGSINPSFLELATEVVKQYVKNMYFTPLQVTKKLAVFNLRYWEGYPILEEGWPAYWAQYYFAGSQWYIPLLRPTTVKSPTPMTTTTIPKTVTVTTTLQPLTTTTITTAQPMTLPTPLTATPAPGLGTPLYIGIAAIIIVILSALIYVIVKRKR